MPAFKQKEPDVHTPCRTPRRRAGGLLAIAGALASLLCAGTASAQSYATMRYNQVRQKQIHNSMDAQENLLDILNYWNVRAVELDMHNGYYGSDYLVQDWFIYHWNYAEDTSRIATLQDGFKELATFHHDNPKHEVVTVYLDMHDTFTNGGPHQTADDLDALIDAFFPFNNSLASSATYTPSHMFALCPTCRGQLVSCVSTAAARQNAACQWPLLSDLRGKFIFVMTGDAAITSYNGDGFSGAVSRRAFTSHDYDSSINANAFSSTNPGGLRPWEVFYQADGTGNAVPVATVAGQDNLMTRVYDLDDQTSLNDMRFLGGPNLIATDDVNSLVDPWFSTSNAHGFPFECNLKSSASVCNTEHESVDPNNDPTVFNMTVASGDIWGTSDSMGFAELTDSADDTWTVRIDAPSSHVASWAKACLMFRANRGASAPYYAVCRTADNEDLQVQVRTCEGCSTSTLAEASEYRTQLMASQDVVERTWQSTLAPYTYYPPGVAGESISYVKLVASTIAGSQIITPSGSRDGVNWVQIASPMAFTPGLLKFRGIAVSSYDGSEPVQWRFARFVTPFSTFPFSVTASFRKWLIGNSGGSVQATNANLGNCIGWESSCAPTVTGDSAYLFRWGAQYND